MNLGLPLFMINSIAILDDRLHQVDGGMIRHEMNGREFQENNVRSFPRLYASHFVSAVNSGCAVDGQGCDDFLYGHIHLHLKLTAAKKSSICFPGSNSLSVH
mgnify:CR=1 FL=1